eukprot:SAG11_NODE_9594_length_897_cov_1.271930_2_plen_53_part_00
MCCCCDHCAKVRKQGWSTLFKHYDADSSGEIDFDEFISAARNDLNIASDAMR